MDIKLNESFEKNYIVQESNSAKAMGSGDLEVLATPSLVAFMENAAKEYLNNLLSSELGSVGSNININHLAPTLIGKTIIVKGIVKDIIKEKMIIFSLEAFDDDKKIGEAEHTRVIINNKKFLERLK